MISIERKLGKDLSVAELDLINSARAREFGATDRIQPQPGSINWEADFFFLKEDEKVVAFIKLHLMKVVFHEETFPVYCISTLISLEQGRGYGCRILSEIKTFLAAQEKNAFLFCETELLPFYQKCGMDIIPRNDNHFYFIEKNGEKVTNPNIIPGEVIVIRGKDGLVEKILASSDKRVGVID